MRCDDQLPGQAVGVGADPDPGVWPETGGILGADSAGAVVVPGLPQVDSGYPKEPIFEDGELVRFAQFVLRGAFEFDV